jgi:hypothetical protein
VQHWTVLVLRTAVYNSMCSIGLFQFGILQPFLHIYKVSNYSTVNVNIYNTIIVEGDRNTGTHHTEARIVDSSTEELEQSNTQSDCL